ncbi:MAG: Rv1535 domain-containing protein [Mycobacterium sp.]|uniref:Rv1535 domain-containing protein n=1 Tax=Mycobacterium sp. TaxID=1785 RepID=UPI003F96E0FE
MSTKESVGDPLVSSIASVLKVPLVELYALLWRVGVVEIRHRDRTPHRSSRAYQARTVLCPTCPNLRRHESERLSRRPAQRRPIEPAPNRADPAVCGRAIG